jgi:hypothetical protein
MPLYYVRSMGGNLALIEPMGAGHPDQGLPISPGHPDQGLPGGGYGGRPDNTLPGGGQIGQLPSGPPPTVLPGWTLVLVRKPDGKWAYATLAPGSAAPKPLPEPIPPGGAPDQGLPPQPPGGVVSPPIAPTPAPKPV